MASVLERLEAAERLANQRKLENDDLQKEIDSLRSTLKERQQRLRELEVQLSSLETDRGTERVELHRVKQEIILLKEQLEVTKREYERRLADNTEEWKSALKRASDRDAALSKVKIEKAGLEGRTKTLEAEVKRLQERLNASLEAQTVAEQSLAAVQRDRDEELIKCKTYAARCKAVEEEATREKERAMNLVTEAQHSVKKIQEEFAGEKKKMEEEFRAQMAAEKSKKLNLDLSQAVVSAVSQTAAEEMLRNRGLTLTSLYTELVDEKEISRQLKEEVDRLNAYLAKIVEEVEHSAPELLNARLEYSRVLANCDALNEKLADLFSENAQLREEMAKLVLQNERYEQENKELGSQAEDLAAQVRSLLAQSAQGTVEFSSPPRQAKVSSDDPQMVISDNLVQFGNISELQEQNQRLLRLVRKLADENERKSFGPTSDDAIEKLHQAEEEIRRMSEARERQEAMILAIVRQRDMYRSLLRQNDEVAKRGEPQGSASQLALIPGDRAIQEEIKTELEFFKRETQEESDHLKNQIASYTDRLRESEAKLAASNAERGALHERGRIIGEALDSARAELDRIREANVGYETQLAKLQVLLEERRQALDESERVKLNADRDREMARTEAKLAREELESLKGQLQVVIEQRDSQREIASQWEKSLAEARDRLNQIMSERDKAEKLVSDNANELARVRKENADNQARVESARAEMRAKVEEALREAQQAKESLARVQGEAETLRRTEISLKEQIDRILAGRSANSPRAQNTGSSAALSVELVDLRAELERTQRELEQRAKDAAAFKTIAAESDDAFKLLQASHDTLKASSEERERILIAEKAEVKHKLQALENRLKHGQDEVSKLSQQLEAARAKESELDSLRERMAQAEIDVKRLEREATIASENYSRELQLHAADMSAVTDLRKQVESLKVERDQRSKQFHETEMKTLTRIKELEAEYAASSQRLETLKNELADSRSENRKLLEQLERSAALMSVSHGGAVSLPEQELREMLVLATRARDKLSLEREQLSLDIGNLRSQLEEARRSATRAHEELNRMAEHVANNPERQRVQTLEQELSVLRALESQRASELQATRAKLDQSRSELTAAREREVEIIKKETEAKSRKEAIERQLATKEHELKLLQGRFDTIRQRVADAELVDKLKAEIVEKDKQLDEVRRSRDMLNKSLVNHKEVRRQLEEAEAKVKELQTKTTQEEAEAVKLKSELETKVKALSELEGRMNNKDTQLQRFREALKNYRETESNLQQQIKDLQVQLSTLQSSKSAIVLPNVSSDAPVTKPDDADRPVAETKVQSEVQNEARTSSEAKDQVESRTVFLEPIPMPSNPPANDVPGDEAGGKSENSGEKTSRAPILGGPATFGQATFGSPQPSGIFGSNQSSGFGSVQVSGFGSTQPSGMFGSSQPSSFGTAQPSGFGSVAPQSSAFGSAQPSGFAAPWTWTAPAIFVKTEAEQPAVLGEVPTNENKTQVSEDTVQKTSPAPGRLPSPQKVEPEPEPVSSSSVVDTAPIRVEELNLAEVKKVLQRAKMPISNDATERLQILKQLAETNPVQLRTWIDEVRTERQKNLEKKKDLEKKRQHLMQKLQEQQQQQQQQSVAGQQPKATTLEKSQLEAEEAARLVARAQRFKTDMAQAATSVPAEEDNPKKRAKMRSDSATERSAQDGKPDQDPA